MTEDILATGTQRPLRRALDALRCWFGLGLFGMVGVLWTLFALPMYYVLPRRSGARLGRWLLHAAFRIYLRVLAWDGSYRFDLGALDALRGEGPLIIAPNHPSLIDAVLVISRLPTVACVMKSNIMDNPSLGAGARLARYIRNDDPLQMIRAAVRELRSGQPLLLFPEGTRSTRRPMAPLRASVALIARQARVPIQTILIETDSAFLGKGWPLSRVPRQPITCRVRLGRRFDPPQDVRACIAEMDAYFRDALANALLPDALPAAPVAGSARDRPA